MARALALVAAAFAYRGLLAYPELPHFEYTAGFWLLQPGSTWPALGVAGAFWLWLRRRRRLLALPARRASALAALLLMAAVGSLLWANLRGAVTPLVVSVAAIGLAWAAWQRGGAGCRVMALPAAFLLFAVPTPAPLSNEIVWRLQLWTAELSAWLVSATGAPTQVQTLLIAQPDRSFLVIESCTGWRVAEILTALAVLLREGCLGAGRLSWLPVLLAPVLALALNVLRIAAIVLAPPAATGDHAFQALLLVALGTLLLSGGVVALRRASLGRSSRSEAKPSEGTRARALLPAAACALLAGLFFSLAPEPWRDSVAPTNPALSLPLELGGWTAERLQPDHLFLGSVRFDATFVAEYARSQDRVHAFVGLERGRLGRSSGRSPKTLLPGSGWRIQSRGHEQLARVPRLVDAAIVSNEAGLEALVLHWRSSDAGLAAETLEHLLGLRREPRTVVRLLTPIADRSVAELQAAQGRLRDFAADLHEPLEKLTAAPTHDDARGPSTLPAALRASRG